MQSCQLQEEGKTELWYPHNGFGHGDLVVLEKCKYTGYLRKFDFPTFLYRQGGAFYEKHVTIEG